MATAFGGLGQFGPSLQQYGPQQQPASPVVGAPLDMRLQDLGIQGIGGAEQAFGNAITPATGQRYGAGYGPLPAQGGAPSPQNVPTQQPAAPRPAPTPTQPAAGNSPRLQDVFRKPAVGGGAIQQAGGGRNQFFQR